jgi:hypothetical protein
MAHGSTFPTTRVGYIGTTREEKNIFLFSLDDNTANKADKVQGRIFFFFFSSFSWCARSKNGSIPLNKLYKRDMEKG